jgi:hypothetical protein
MISHCLILAKIILLSFIFMPLATSSYAQKTVGGRKNQQIKFVDYCGSNKKEASPIEVKEGKLSFKMSFYPAVSEGDVKNHLALLVERRPIDSGKITQIQEEGRVSGGNCFAIEIDLVDWNWTDYMTLNAVWKYWTGSKERTAGKDNVKLKYLAIQFHKGDRLQKENIVPEGNKLTCTLTILPSKKEDLRYWDVYFLTKDGNTRQLASPRPVAVGNKITYLISETINPDDEYIVARGRTFTLEGEVRLRIQPNHTWTIRESGGIEKNTITFGCNGTAKVGQFLFITFVDLTFVESINFQIKRNGICENISDTQLGYMENSAMTSLQARLKILPIELIFGHSDWRKIEALCVFIKYKNQPIPAYFEIPIEKDCKGTGKVRFGGVVLEQGQLKKQWMEELKSYGLDTTDCMLDIRLAPNVIEVTLDFSCDHILMYQDGYVLGQVQDVDINKAVGIIFKKVSGILSDIKTTSGGNIPSILSPNVGIEGYAVGLTDAAKVKGIPLFDKVGYFEYWKHPYMGRLVLSNIKSDLAKEKTSITGKVNFILDNYTLGAYRGFFLKKEASTQLSGHFDAQTLQSNIRVVAKEHSDYGPRLRGSFIHCKILLN